MINELKQILQEVREFSQKESNYFKSIEFPILSNKFLAIAEKVSKVETGLGELQTELEKSKPKTESEE